MNNKRSGYLNQASMNERINSQKSSISTSDSQTSNNASNMQGASPIKVGRNEPRPVKPENSLYKTNKNVDTSFTHSITNVKMTDFGVSILEEQGISDENIIIEKLSEEKVDYNHVEPKKKNTKVIKIIGFISIIILGIVGIYNLMKSLNSSEVLICSLKEKDELNHALIEKINVYSFKDDIIYKKEEINNYKFDNKEAFELYRKNYIDSGIYDISGITYEKSFNTSSLSFDHKVNYDLNKISTSVYKVEKTSKNIQIIDDNSNVILDIDILSKDDILSLNSNQGYTCNISK